MGYKYVKKKIWESCKRFFQQKILHVQKHTNKDFNKPYTNRHMPTRSSKFSEFLHKTSFIFVLVPEVTHILKLKKIDLLITHKCS